MRVVLDTNILVSALITNGTPPDQLYQAWLRNKIELVTSAEVAEIIDVLSRPRLRRYIDSDEAAQMVAAIRQTWQSHVVASTSLVLVLVLRGS